jgi:hypothetical protein
MAAALSHLRDLDQDTRAIIEAVEAERVRLNSRHSESPKNTYRLLSSGRPPGVYRAVCFDSWRGHRRVSSGTPLLRLCTNAAKGVKREPGSGRVKR